MGQQQEKTVAEVESAYALARAPLQSSQPPKDRVFYARHHVALKWTPYKPNSQEVKRGKMGRWQELRPYGIGWQNSDVTPQPGAWVEDVLNRPELLPTPNTPASNDFVLVREAAQRLVDRFPADLPDYSPAADEVKALRLALAAALASPEPASNEAPGRGGVEMPMVVQFRVADGQQFNAYEATDGSYIIGIGPVSGCLQIARTKSPVAADYIVDLLRAASGQAPAVCRVSA